MVNVTLCDVDHVQELNHHLFSLRVTVDLGHENRGNKKCVSDFLNSGPSLFIHSKENLNYVLVVGRSGALQKIDLPNHCDRSRHCACQLR